MLNYNICDRMARHAGLSEQRRDARRSEISRRATFGLSPGHELGQFLADGVVHGWRLETPDDVLEHLVRPLCSPDAASQIPGLVVAPVAQERLIERLFIAILGVLDAKEMPVMANLADRIERNVIRAGRIGRGLEIALDLLQISRNP